MALGTMKCYLMMFCKRSGGCWTMRSISMLKQEQRIFIELFLISLHSTPERMWRDPQEINISGFTPFHPCHEGGLRGCMRLTNVMCFPLIAKERVGIIIIASGDLHFILQYKHRRW